MSTAPKTDLRREILRALREDLEYAVQPDDTGDTLTASKINYAKSSAKVNRSYEKSNQMMNFPGLVLSSPKRTVIPPSEGDNERDLWHYLFLIQLVDADLWDIENRVATWEKWIYQIASYFNQHCFGTEELSEKTVYALGTATSVDDVDEKMWVKHSQFISGVLLEIQVLQHRGVVV